jgi:hypothetical protein
MRDLQTIRDKAIEAGAWSAAVQAEYRRGQALGTIYVDRKEVRIGTIDSMSKEEVMKKLEEIKKIYGGPPPTAILEMESRVVEEEPIPVEPQVEFDPGELLSLDGLGEERALVTKKRAAAFRQIEAELDDGSSDEVGDAGELGDSGPISGAPEFAFRSNRVEGS